MSEEKKDINYTEEEAVRLLDEQYEIYKDKIPAIFHKRFKLITCAIGTTMCFELKYEEEKTMIDSAIEQINLLKNDLDSVIKALKEYRENIEEEINYAETC